MKLPKRMWAERKGDELYVYWNGQLIYKRWYKRNSLLKRASILINRYWPNEWLP